MCHGLDRVVLTIIICSSIFFRMEVGFNIEGRADNELPECMLGSTVLSFINEKTGPMITPELQQPVHEHQS